MEFNPNIPQPFVFPDNILETLTKICSEHNTSFISVERNGLIGFSYRGCNYRIFVDEIRCWMRGLCVDAKTGSIVIRALRKFYNFSECPNEGFSFFKNGKMRKFNLLEKYDGSLVSCNYFQNRLYVTMKTGETDPTAGVREFMSHNDSYEKLIRHLSNEGYTSCFEYLDPDRPIVIHYERKHMIFISAIHNYTGRSMTYDEIVALAVKFGIPYAKSLELESESGEMQDFEKKRDLYLSSPGTGDTGDTGETEFVEFLKKEIDSKKNIEGYILWFEDEEHGNNERYKFKTTDYFAKSAMFSTVLGKHYALWGLIFSSFLEEMGGQNFSQNQNRNPKYMGYTSTISLDDLRSVRAEDIKSSTTIGDLEEEIRVVLDETVKKIYDLLNSGKYQTIRDIRNSENNTDSKTILIIFKSDKNLEEARRSVDSTRNYLVSALNSSCVSRQNLLRTCSTINPEFVKIFEKYEKVKWFH